MSLLNAIKLITEYSITVVLSGIVIYFVVRAINQYFDNKSSDHHKDEHDTALSLRSSLDEPMYDVLNEFLENHNGSRIQVIEFTNSVVSVSYLPFKYMSCTYEVIAYGFKPGYAELDKVPTSLFGPFLARLGKADYISVDPGNCEDLPGMAKYIYDEGDCDNCVFVMMKSSKDSEKCIGYIAFYKDKAVEQKDIDDMEALGVRVSTLLSVCDKEPIRRKK